MKTNDLMRYRARATAAALLRLAFTLARVLDPLGSHAQEMACGQTVTDALQSAGQTNTYSFVATAGDCVTVLALGQPLNPVVGVYSPSGSQVGGCTNNFTGPLRLSSSGTYTIQVHAADPASTGTFGLSLSFLTGRCGRLLIWGPPVTNRVALLAEVDSYTFSGRAGETVVLNVTRADGDLVPAAYIAGPDGTVMANWVNNSTASLELASNGTYTVGVYSFYFGATGVYSLSLFCTQLVPASFRLAIENTNGAAALSLWGQPGRMTTLECQTDLTATNGWFTLTNFSLPWSPYRFVDWAAQAPARFYRTAQ